MMCILERSSSRRTNYVNTPLYTTQNVDFLVFNEDLNYEDQVSQLQLLMPCPSYLKMTAFHMASKIVMYNNTAETSNLV